LGERLTLTIMRVAAGQFLPTPHGRVYMPGVELDPETTPAGAFGRDDRRSAAHERVEHDVVSLGTVDNVQKRVAEWKAAGVPVLPGTNNRPDQAFVVTPDGVRIEILEDKTQTVPVKNEHIHLFVPESDIPKAQAWYAKTFGGTAATRNNAAVVDGIPGVQIRFAKADTAQAPTRHRILDHIGFDVKDHAAFVKKLEADGIKLDEPPRQATPASNKITYITDPWGTRIEIIERAPLGTPVN
jgi:catechol 2,3-dioxygenase-like lactoylglutathione lyase family enzyme